MKRAIGTIAMVLTIGSLLGSGCGSSESQEQPNNFSVENAYLGDGPVPPSSLLSDPDELWLILDLKFGEKLLCGLKVTVETKVDFAPTKEIEVEYSGCSRGMINGRIYF